MKNLIYILLVVLAPAALQAQTLSKKEARKHRNAIEESRKDGSIIESLDTVYYRGNAQFVMLFDHSKYYPENFTVKALTNDVIYINAKDYTGNWVEFVFPTMDMNKGYVKVTCSFEKVARTIIEQGLMTDDGLNETNVRNFLETYKTVSKSAINRALDGLFDSDTGNEEKKPAVESYDEKEDQ